MPEMPYESYGWDRKLVDVSIMPISILYSGLRARPATHRATNCSRSAAASTYSHFAAPVGSSSTVVGSSTQWCPPTPAPTWWTWSAWRACNDTCWHATASNAWYDAVLAETCHGTPTWNDSWFIACPWYDTLDASSKRAPLSTSYKPEICIGTDHPTSSRRWGHVFCCRGCSCTTKESCRR